MNCAIITARGGSKRIINKNIKIFIDKPIILFTIEKIFDSKIFDMVIVSTDSEEIASLVSNFNSAIILDERPKLLAGDETSTNDVISYLIEKYDLIDHTVFCIYPTAALMEIDDLIVGYNEFNSHNYKMIYCAAKFLNSPFRAVVLKKNKIAPLFKKYINYRSQDLEDSFFDVGFFYIAKAKTWLDGINIFDRKSSFIEIPNNRAIDINTHMDWEFAEMLYKKERCI